MQAIRKAHVSVEDYKTRNSISALNASAEKPLKAQSSLRYETRISEYSFQDKYGMNLNCVQRISFQRLSNSSIYITHLDAEKYTLERSILQTQSILSSTLLPFLKAFCARRIINSSKLS